MQVIEQVRVGIDPRGSAFPEEIRMGVHDFDGVHDLRIDGLVLSRYGTMGPLFFVKC